MDLWEQFARICPYFCRYFQAFLEDVPMINDEINKYAGQLGTNEFSVFQFCSVNSRERSENAFVDVEICIRFRNNSGWEKGLIWTYPKLAKPFTNATTRRLVPLLWDSLQNGSYYTITIEIGLPTICKQIRFRLCEV